MSLQAKEEKRKFRASLKPKRVSVFLLLKRVKLGRFEQDALTEGLTEAFLDYEGNSPFDFTFCIDDECLYRRFWYTRHVIIVSDSLEMWMDMYEKVKKMEPRSVGGGIALGGLTLSDEMRKALETTTGGHLPLFLTAATDSPYSMVDETLKQIDSILIQQEISLAARKREHKVALRKQKERNVNTRRITTWIRVGWKYHFSDYRMEKDYDSWISCTEFIEGDEAPTKKKCVNSDFLLLVSTCPKKLLEMYDLAKKEWDQKKEIDFALLDCALSKKEKKELESHLDGHLPHYCWEGQDVHEGIYDAISHFERCKSYERMTKARLKERRCVRSEKPTEGAVDDSDSAVSFHSVDELPSDYEEREGREWTRTSLESDDEEHDCTNCISAAEADKMLDEAFFAIYGATESLRLKMHWMITRTDNWLQKVFDHKQKALVAEYMKENSEPPTEEARKGIKRKASEHTEVVLRKVKWTRDEEEIRAQMKGLQKEILNVESSSVDSHPPPTGESPSEGCIALEQKTVASGSDHDSEVASEASTSQ